MGALSAERVFELIHKDFSKIRDHRNSNKLNISVVDCLMSGFAIFALKFESLLQFEAERKLVEDVTNYRSNLKSLFTVNDIPSDTQMRTILDDIEPNDIRKSFKTLFDRLQWGHYLHSYEFINRERRPVYLMPVDGTGYFYSNKINCKNCLTRKERNTGEVTHQHQMLAAAIVHPHLATVIPLAPEPIVQQARWC